MEFINKINQAKILELKSTVTEIKKLMGLTASQLVEQRVNSATSQQKSIQRI